MLEYGFVTLDTQRVTGQIDRINWIFEREAGRK